MYFSSVLPEEEPEAVVGRPVESWLAVFTVVGTVKACTLLPPKLSLNVRLIAMFAEVPAPAPMRLPFPNPANPPGRLKFPGNPRLRLPLLLVLVTEVLFAEAPAVAVVVE